MLTAMLLAGHLGLSVAINGVANCGGIWDVTACNCAVDTDSNTVCAWDTASHTCLAAAGGDPAAECSESGTHACSDVTEPLTCACTEGCLWAYEQVNGAPVGVCLDGLSAGSPTLTDATSFPLFLPDVEPRVPSYVCRCRTLHTGSQHTGPEESCFHSYPTDIDLLLASSATGSGAYAAAVATVINANVNPGPVVRNIPDNAIAASSATPAGCSLTQEVTGTSPLTFNFGNAIPAVVAGDPATDAQPGLAQTCSGSVGASTNAFDVVQQCKIFADGCCTITRAKQTLGDGSLAELTNRHIIVNGGGSSTNFPSPVATANQAAQVRYGRTSSAAVPHVKVDPTAADFVNPFELDVFFNNDYNENANPYTGAPMTYGCGGGAPILSAPALASANAITFDDGVQFAVTGPPAYVDVLAGSVAGSDVTPPISFGTPYTSVLGVAGPAFTGQSFRFPTAGSGTSRWKFSLGVGSRLGDPALRPAVPAEDLQTVGGIDDGFGLVADDWPTLDVEKTGDIACQCGYHRQPEDSAISVDAYDLPPLRSGARPLANSGSPNGWTCSANSNCASGRCEFGGGLAGKVCVPANWPNPSLRFEVDDSSD